MSARHSDDHAAAAAYLAQHVAPFPETVIQLGSGLGAIAAAVEARAVLDYAGIPGYPKPSVAGHIGRLVVGDFAGAPVAVLQGRVHYYEGRGFGPLKVLIRSLHAAGARRLILTNAAGSLDPAVGPGRLMAIRDHINLSGANPLIGPNDDALGPRFLDLTAAYDPVLLRALHAAATDCGIDLAEGVYLMVSGPSFETPAEIRAFRRLGADVVGMSTVPECLVARHLGMSVAVVSTITNYAAGLNPEPLTHDETMRVGAAAATDLSRLLGAFVPRITARGAP